MTSCAILKTFKLKMHWLLSSLIPGHTSFVFQVIFTLKRCQLNSDVLEDDHKLTRLLE